jgi:uncharacterized protein (DUF433 family)
VQLEDYFDFVTPADIRLKGHRIGIETVLWDYLEGGLAPEEIAFRYPTLSLEEICATLTYYWRHRSQVESYLRSVDLEIERLKDRLGPRASSMIRYEDLCTDVQSVLRRLHSAIGLDAPAVPKRPRTQHILGNRMRLTALTEIRLDEKWRGALTQRELVEFDRLAGETNRRYGYT